MDLILNDVNISQVSDVQISGCIYNDCVAGRADSVELTFADPQNLWRNWAPKKGDIFEVVHNSIRSGKMYISNVFVKANNFTLMGSATPPKALVPLIASYENIRLSELVTRLAGLLDMQVDVSNVTDRVYLRFDSHYETVPKALQRLCIMESLGLKAFDGKFIFIPERQLEQEAPVMTLTADDFSNAVFGTTDLDLLRAVSVQYVTSEKSIVGYWEDASIIGGHKIVEMPVASQGEAERFAKGILRVANRQEITGAITIPFSEKIAAGCTIRIEGYGSFSGDYYIERVAYDLINMRERLSLRQPIRGGY